MRNTDFNIKNKLTASLGILVGIIIILVILSVVYLQMLTMAEPTSQTAKVGLPNALVWVATTGAAAIAIGLWMLIRVPAVINAPIKELINGIKEIANHNYDVMLNLSGSKEADEVSESFNRMARRLRDYHNSTYSQLMSSKKYLETIINSISEPIIGLDNDLNILFISKEALNVLNLKMENTINMPANDIALNNDLLRRLLVGMKDYDNLSETTSDSSRKKDEPLKIYANDKESYFQVKYMGIYMTGNDGKTSIKKGHVIMLKNITEFQKLNTAKTTFISTISHELKTPISAILMSLQLLENDKIGNLNTEQAELSHAIKDNAERLLSITGELLNMTQVESGKLQLKLKITKPVELIEYAIKANRVQAEKFGIHIEVAYPENGKIKKLFIDSEKIAWVLTNLLSNAIRYSSENGRVIVGARQPDNKHIELYVQDFGKGIDERYHESIFEHYFRVPGTKVQGSGLGLAISRDFMEAHGGSLTVDSKIGKGSIFTMRFTI